MISVTVFANRSADGTAESNTSIPPSVAYMQALQTAFGKCQAAFLGMIYRPAADKETHGRAERSSWPAVAMPW